MSPDTSASNLLTTVWKNRGFPVDSAWISGQLGVLVLETTLPSEVSYALIKAYDQDPKIVLAKSDSRSRKRMACAQALGRYVFRSNAGEAAYSCVSLRVQPAQEGNDEETVFSVQFARALLMPKEAFEDIETRSPLFLMAWTFGVCPEAMVDHLKDSKARRHFSMLLNCV